MKTHITLAALILAAFAGSAIAQTNTPVIDKRLENQTKRIEQGEKTGQLTPKEAAILEKKEAKLSNAVAQAKSDGVVTKKERVKLTKMENKQSKRIHKQKHDAQTTAPAGK
jgi:hypothetical protein